ncbi:MAG: dTDP-4-dehydrorhamnose reductase [Parcubacteria group bacterium]|nr:dTDP-4-dehydrorhamnose reductase [Parcubacteria group bacterium]
MISKNAAVLIVGASGQLGFDLMRVFGDRAVGLTHRDIEVSNFEKVAQIVKSHKPALVINVAAFVKAEECETKPELCFNVNAVGAFNVAKAASDVGADIVYLSTDYVFDGSKRVFRENDAINPLNVYGASKAAGESLVKIANSRHYIIRSSWFFGANLPHKGLDFPRKMLELARRKSEMKVVNDQFGSPTYTKDLAFKIKEVVQCAPYGVYHITNQGAASWFDFAKEVLRVSGSNIKPSPIPTSESGSKIRRPKSSVLENAKLKKLNIGLLRPWQEALSVFFKEISKRGVNNLRKNKS